MDRSVGLALIGVCCLLVSGCASSRQNTFPLEYQLPPDLQRQVEQRVSFANVKADPAAYKVRFILLGGEVLKAKRLADRTRLEILHLPLNEFNEPVMNRTASQGRYLAFQKEFLDPATVPPGTRITLVGEVTGTTEGDLDDMKYSYVTLEIRHLQIWPQTPMPYARARPTLPSTPMLTCIVTGIPTGASTGSRIGPIHMDSAVPSCDPDCGEVTRYQRRATRMPMPPDLKGARESSGVV